MSGKTEQLNGLSKQLVKKFEKKPGSGNFINFLIAEIESLNMKCEGMDERVKNLTEACFARAEERDALQEKYDKLIEENGRLKSMNETAAITGWICPRCDNSNYPFVTVCSCGDEK